MTTKHRTRGFVFKKNDRAESDRIYSVFTEDYGRIEIFGKAIRKINSKLKGGIDIFYFSEIEFIQGKSNRTLTGAVKIKSFKMGEDFSAQGGPASGWEKTKIAYKITDVLDDFLKGQEKDENIYNLVNEVLEKLDDQQLDKNRQLIYYYFIWNFLSLQGYGVQTYKCVLCSEKLNPAGIYFSDKEGGIICEKCLERDKTAKEINADVVKILRIILEKNWDILLRLKVENASRQLLEDISENAITAFCPS
jgi:DNA repair protein RecO (recombination protein O)